MKLNWFRRIGLVYVPGHRAGWIILVVSLGLAIYLFFDIDSRSHSVSDTIINFMLNFLIIGAFYTLIAFLTSSRTTGTHSENTEH
jgi:tryptophan-rich sensory protein